MLASNYSQRMTEPLQSFDSADDDVPLFLARSWAERTVNALRDARALRRRFRSLDEAHERMDVDHLTWNDVQTAFGEAWTAECLLVITASQFEVWLTKLYLARGRPAPERMPYLRELRNAVVHLDESEIDEDEWTATPGPSQGRGLGALPHAELTIWLNGTGNILNVISADTLEAHVDTLLDELGEELDDFARDWYEMLRSGR